MKKILLRDWHPAFCSELESLIENTDLSRQVRDLEVHERCRCGEEGCAHFYTAEPPSGTYGPGHINVMLAPEFGDIVLDILSGQIVAVEVLDRPDVKERLDEIFPSQAEPSPSNQQ